MDGTYIVSNFLQHTKHKNFMISAHHNYSQYTLKTYYCCALAYQETEILLSPSITPLNFNFRP